MSYATRPIVPPRRRRLPPWAVWTAGGAGILAALALVTVEVLAALAWAEYVTLRAEAGAAYCADPPPGVDTLHVCRDAACLERKAAALDANSEALIRYAVICDRVLDRKGGHG